MIWRQAQTILLVAATATVAFGQGVSIGLSSGSGVPGGMVSLNISLNSSPGDEPSGIQWTLNYSPQNFTAVQVGEGSAATEAGKSISCAPGVGSYTCLVAGINGNTMANGVVAVATLTLSETLTNPCAAVQLTNAVAASLDGSEIPTATSDGLVTISQTPCMSPSGGLVNAASFISGAVAPGEIISIFGAAMGPSSAAGLRLNASGLVDSVLADTRVLFDGAPAPLIFVQANQINAAVPYGVMGKQRTEVQVEYSGRMSRIVAVLVADTAPGIFTLGRNGQAAALNEDGTVNSASNPAGRGSIVALYATGEGQTDPPGTDGKVASDVLPRPRLPVSVRVAGLEAEILYAGAAPGLIAGVLQVNARIPAGVSGDAIPILLSVGNATSQAGVTLAVQ